jgi:hypothetical protein
MTLPRTLEDNLKLKDITPKHQWEVNHSIQKQLEIKMPIKLNK